MVRRRKPIETKVNHERWLVSYADLVTLLFAFFVVMYSVSQVNEEAYKELTQTLRATFPQQVSSSAASPDADGISAVDLAGQVRTALAELTAAGHAQVRTTDDWVEITVGASLLFASGSAEPGDEAKAVFARVSELLAPYENAIEVSGHTDNVPIANGAFDNNWDLSAARATAVVQLLAGNGVAPERLVATGYGEFRPVADNTTEEGRARNRRVVLKVARWQAPAPPLPDAKVPAVLPYAPREAEAGSARQRELPAGGADAVGEGAAPVAEKRPLLEPIVRDDGSLLFTSDPDARKPAAATEEGEAESR